MNFANIMKVYVECENNPVIQKLRMEQKMQEHKRMINRHITSKLLSEINADIEKITSEMKNETP